MTDQTLPIQNPPPPLAPIPKPPVPGPKIMAIGEVGTGKTHMIRELVNVGLEVFVLVTEPGIQTVLGDIPPDKLHWNYLAPVPLTFDMLMKQAEQINTMSFQQLADLKTSRNEFRQMLDFVNLMRDFKCERTGRSYGPVNKFGNDKAFVVDSMSGLTMMAVNSFVGTRPALGPSDYGVVQKLLESTVNSLAMTLNCWFLLTAHAEKEVNELTGVTDVMASTLGRKLAPKLGRFFDEVVMTKRDGQTFVWSNMERNAALKKRMLPLSDKLEPNFKLLMSEWRKRTQ